MFGPNFFIIGATKAATTSLSSLLELHPQAAIALGKEPHFFTYEERYQWGWETYLTLYAHCQGQKAVGEASTSYSRLRKYPATVDRIKSHVPEAKIIYMVRHPLRRMESAYVEIICSQGSKIFTSINDIVRRQPMVLDSSRYWEVFDAYRQEFDESKIKIVWFEEYIADTKAVFQDVCRFLEIDDTVEPDLERQRTNSRENASARLAMINREHLRIDTNWEPDVRQWAIDQLRSDNTRFLKHFGRPMDYWGPLF